MEEQIKLRVMGDGKIKIEKINKDGWIEKSDVLDPGGYSQMELLEELQRRMKRLSESY